MVLAIEYIAYTRHEPANVGTNGAACLFSVIALAAGGYAMNLQKRRWSYRARKRLMLGMPIAVVTLVMTVMNFCEKLPSAERTSGDMAVADTGILEGPGSQELLAAGWYGKGEEDGVVAVVVSFAENSAESLAFNRALRQRVSYATLTVINQSRPQPTAVRCSNVGVVLDSGAEMLSMEAKPLVRVTGAVDEVLMQRLAEVRTLPTGAVASDIPICLNADFKWERVRAVKVAFDNRVIVIPGRMMTGDEKFSVLMESNMGAKSEVEVPADSFHDM